MFDRFSDHARQAMAQARQHALRLRHPAIAPEHLLLGLLAQGHTDADVVMSRAGIEREALRLALQTALPPGHEPAEGRSQLPFTPEAKRVLEAMMHEALSRSDRHLGSVHLLLGLAAVPESMPAQILAKLGADLPTLRRALDQAVHTLEREGVRLLLISNSTMHGGGYLEHCAAQIRDFLGSRQRVLFVPYALADHDGYAAKAKTAFEALGHELVSVHTREDGKRAVDEADAVFIGGGNTFRLLNALYEHSLLPAIQRRALLGMPYIGSSAGTNVATLSIRTTNDMPIVQPPSFTALQLVPFQINPHYLDPDPASKHMGETREERLRQFHEEHDTPVLGLREGCMLRVEGKQATLLGTTNARLFRRGEAPREFVPPCDLSFLLDD